MANPDSITQLFAILGIGFFLGMRHASDPDHVIAVSTIVTRERRVGQAHLIGALWGLGHTFTVLLVGGAIILFGLVIPPWLGLSMEFSVGVMLVLLGALNVAALLRTVTDQEAVTRGTVHTHAHAHGDYIHTHAHRHDPESHPHRSDAKPVAWIDRHFGGLSSYRLARPVVIGLVHGMAGSAAIALLILATIQDSRWALGYLVVFGIGTIVGMMLITTIMGSTVSYAQNRFVRFGTGLQAAAGILSLCFGLFLAYQIGIVHGLFTGHPQWIPR
jgi:high-affinity nickel-transport protein